MAYEAVVDVTFTGHVSARDHVAAQPDVGRALAILFLFRRLQRGDQIIFGIGILGFGCIVVGTAPDNKADPCQLNPSS